MDQHRIKQLRLTRAWSQERLAELASLSVRTIQRIENGEQASLETLSAIAAAFEIKVAEIMGQDTQPDEALDQQIEAAKQRVAAESGFYRSLATYAVVNLFLFIINRIATPESQWFIWPLTIWGTLLALRGAKIFFLHAWLQRWQQVRLQKLLRK